MIKVILALILLTGCAQAIKTEKVSQDTFANGCMTAYLSFKSNGTESYVLRDQEDEPFTFEKRYAEYWCTLQYKTMIITSTNLRDK